MFAPVKRSVCGKYFSLMKRFFFCTGQRPRSVHAALRGTRRRQLTRIANRRQEKPRGFTLIHREPRAELACDVKREHSCVNVHSTYYVKYGGHVRNSY